MKIVKSSEPAPLPKVGQLFTDDRGEVYRVDSVEGGKAHLARKWGEKWSSYGEWLPDDRYIPIKSEDDVRAVYDEVMAHPDSFDIEDEEEDHETTSLAAPTSINTVKSTQALLEDKKRKLRLAQAEIERQRAQVQSMIRGMQKQIAKLQKIIDAFELYLGVHQDLAVLREGQTVSDPITLRQMILYMDEEYGDPRPNQKTGVRGLDFSCVEDFDAWLLQGKHLDQVIPERKGLVAIKVSRHRHNYDESPWVNSEMNAKNRMTYLLIRNGENVYRLWTDIEFGDRLFPTQGEMDKIIETLTSEKFVWESDREKVADAEYIYKRNALIVQGLLDRTEIFLPLAHECSLFKPETYPGCFNLVRDDELTLDDGHLPWKEWQAEINRQIHQGSRVVVALEETRHDYVSRKDYRYRFARDYNESGIPPLPPLGVYQIEDEKIEKDRYFSDRGSPHFYFLYNPGDEVWFGNNWEYDPHTRKNRISFYVTSNDNFILNYDQMTLEDVDYFLTNRGQRKHYLDFTMLLWTLRDQLIAEREKEKDFVNLVAHRTGATEAEVWRAVDWWKFKNKWKRRIDSDDAKALRMIERKLQGGAGGMIEPA